ncbi:MAG: hypothetical protein ACK5XA_08525 [Tagaea sp.]
MSQGWDITVSRTANGFIVSPVDAMHAKGFRHEGARVFSNIEQLTAWMAAHFSRAEQVKAPDSASVIGTAGVLSSGFHTPTAFVIDPNELQLRDRPVEAADWPEAPRRDRLDR